MICLGKPEDYGIPKTTKEYESINYRYRVGLENKNAHINTFRQNAGLA